MPGNWGICRLFITARAARGGSMGCLEGYASTSALVRYYKQAEGEQGLKGKEIMDLVHNEDPEALQAYHLFLDYLATGLASIAHLYNPEIIIIGGGITEQGESFLNDIQAKYDKKVMELYKQSTKLVLATLHNDAGIIWCICCGKQHEGARVNSPAPSLFFFLF